MSIPHLITFKPAGKFYFGTSQSFGESFYASSSRFPSQTTILGTLRATILEQNNKLNLNTRLPIDLNDNELKKLTGTSGMKGIDDIDANFGSIQKMSPVFIVRQKRESVCPEDFLIPVPSDIFINNEGKLCLVDFKPQQGSNVLPGNKRTVSFSAGKKIKDPIADYLGGNQFWNEYKDFNRNKILTTQKEYFTDRIIIRDYQHGIARKDRITREEESLFYTKTDYRMNELYAFAVIVHFEKENILTDSDVFMGGERSLFIMKVEKLPSTLSHVFTNHPIISRFIDDKDFGDYNGSKELHFEKEKLVLVSPFTGKDAALHELEFALIMGIHTPRFLVSREIKTDSFRAIPTGSVLIPSEKLSAIHTYPVALKIGYNFAIKF